MARRPLNLSRDQLASFLKDHEQVKQFEKLFSAARNPQLAGGAAGSIPYQSGDSETTLLPIGAPGQVLQVNPSADAPEWGAYTGTGNVVRATNPSLTNPTITNGRATELDFIGFKNTPALGTVTPGTVYWDDGNGALILNLKGGNVDCLIGEQEYARVYNDTALTLTKGQVVYISGAQGNRVAVKLAQANNDTNSAHTIGFVAETITAGGEGWVQISGPMYKLNTFGTIAGGTVYLSPTTPGLWTTTKPVAPNHLVILGFIERVHETVGSIFIKIDNGYELDELHNVKINSVQPNEILQYDETGPFWKNVNSLSGVQSVIAVGSGGIGYGTGSGGAVTQTTSRTQGVTLNKTNGAITLVSAAGTTAWQSFTVTNSTVAATDTIIVTQKSGTDFYLTHVTNVSSGSFQITFATTGGTTTEQPVFNFSVIKAVTS